MKKKLFFLLTIITALVFAIPFGTAFAEISDGTYNVNYEIKEAGNNNTSIADGYFNKPAKLIVENGTKYVQVTVTGTQYIKSLSGPYGAVSVVSEDKANQTKVVKFQVGDISQPVILKMHIVVPKEVAGMDYDNEHEARAIFDMNSLEKVGSAVNKNDSSNNGAAKAEENPPTGDNSSIGLYVMLLVGSAVAFIVVRKLRPTQN